MRTSARRWLVAALVLALALGIAWMIRARRGATPLAALLPANERTIEPRLSGGFAWAPYRGPVRATEAAIDPRQLRLAGMAGELIEHARADASSDAQREAGIAMLLIERPLDAVATLRAAATRTPSDAALWSDLGAAEHAAALRLDRPSLFPEALAAFDRALSVRADHPEALFNRALTLERLGLSTQARDAWTHYLAVDASSRWADEARERRGRIATTTGSTQFKNDQPRLERAALEGDRAMVAELVARHAQQARSFAEAEYLGRWGEAVQRGDAVEAARMLAIARAIGDALVSTSGETLLADAVRTADAEAHVLYRRGRMTYARQLPAAAEPDLRRAAMLFGDDPMALVARYFAANTRFDQNDVAGARRELEQLLIEANAHPQYAALGAQIRWELALCVMQDDDWSGAIPILTAAEETFRRLGERANLGMIEGMLADALFSAGRPEEGWAARIRSLRTLGTENRGDRFPAAIGTAVWWELRSGRRDVARALLRIQRTALREAGSDSLLTQALVREAVLDAELGDDGAAWTSVREATVVASRIGDDALHARAAADVDFAKGSVLLRSDARQAMDVLAKAIDGYIRAEAPPFLAESHLLRARAALRAGDRDAARHELDAGLEVYERHPMRFADAVVGTGVLDAGPDIFRDAIRLAADRDDVAGAFAYAERFFAQMIPARAATRPVSIAELQRRLAGSGAMVLELVVLPNEVVSIAITFDDVHVERRAGDPRGLDDARLYDLLIRSVEAQLTRSRKLIVVADPSLDAVPFAALVQRVPVAMALSASALRTAHETRNPTSIATVVLAPGENAGLPAASDEIAGIARLYPRAENLGDATFAAVVASHAGVVHIAGHTERQERTGESTLVFAQGERVTWRRAASASFDGSPVIALAACETLRSAATSRARALSLGGGFLAAGAGDVIGTLAPIPDNEAQAIFTEFHRQLAAGRGAAEALRLAQLESIRSGRTAWRAVALLTDHI